MELPFTSQVAVPIDKVDYKAELRTTVQQESLFKEKAEFLETDIAIRKAQVSSGQLYPGHASTFHPVVSVIAKREKTCECSRRTTKTV